MASHPFVDDDTPRITTTASKTTNNTIISRASSSVLKVVLFCSGNGADVASYRPRRDDSQWWNRRDALVRCVASFLFGPANVSKQQKRELVLLYDGDHCRVHMTLDDDDDDDVDETVATTVEAPIRKNRTDHSGIVPSEHVIIGIWKEAIGKAIQHSPQPNCSTEPVVVRRGELHCWVVLSSTPLIPSSSAQNGSHNSRHPTFQHSTSRNSVDQSRRRMIQDWSKRQLLDYLQKECSMEFLREHRLNSNPTVLLRKTNRGALTKVYRHWINTTTKKSKTSGSKTTTKQPLSQKKLLQSIFEEFLEVSNNTQQEENSSPSCSSFIAATLHESSEGELPCFGPHENSHSQGVTNLCLFLGAVRDMIPLEYEALEAACHRPKPIPLVQVRLGSVPEFTSKILSVVAFHHSQGKLGPAMQRLVLEQQHNNAFAQVNSATQHHKDHHFSQIASLMMTPELHIIGLVPLRSDQVVIDLDQRDRTLWCIVRVLVSSLWRSRFASSSSNNNRRTNNPLNNIVTLVFLDGTYITLRQKEWVSSLAEQHQAAPSEYQVLKALIERIQEHKPDAPSKSTPVVVWDQRVPWILDQLLVASDDTAASSARNVIHLQSDAASDVTQQFYTQTEITPYPKSSDSNTTQSIWALMSIASSTSQGDDKGLQEVQKAFLRVFDKEPRWNLSHQSVLAAASGSTETHNSSCCGDWEASSITMLQHFIYQDRLFLGEGSSQKGKTSGEGGEDIKEDSKKGKKKMKDKKQKKSKKKRKHE